MVFVLLGSFAGAAQKTDASAKQRLCTKTSSVPPQQSSISPEPISLHIGEPVEIQIVGGEKHNFGFDVVDGQYVAITIHCRHATPTIKLLDATGIAIDEHEMGTYDLEHTFEFAANASRSYGLQLEGNAASHTPGTCTTVLLLPHIASEKEIWLSQARNLNFRAKTLLDAGKFDEAIDLAQKALVLRERAAGTNHILIADSNLRLGQIFRYKGDYPTAELLLNRALHIYEQTAGPNSRPVAECDKNLGAIYFEKWELDKAGESLQRALDILEQRNETKDRLMTAVLNNSALVFKSEMRYEKAEVMYVRAIGIVEGLYGPNDPAVADLATNLSALYIEKFDYASANDAGRRALSIYEKAFGPESYQVAWPLLNLGSISFKLGEMKQAELYFQRALSTVERTLGHEHPLVALALNNLAEVYRVQQDFSKAEDFDRRALALRERILGDDHPDVAQSLNSIGSLYVDERDYEKAESFLERALAIRVNREGAEHPDVVGTLMHMSKLQMLKRDFVQAEVLLSRAITIGEHNTELNLMMGSESQKLSYLRLLSRQLAQAISLNSILAPEQAAARDLAVTTILQRKGRVQDALADNMKVMRQRLSPADAQLLDQFAGITSQLARLVLGGPQHSTMAEHVNRIDTLKTEREHLEAEISRRSAEFRATSQPVTLAAVRDALPQDAALLEFVEYEPFIPEGITDQEKPGNPRYIVYVIKRTGDVEWKDLGEAIDLDEAIGRFRQALRDPSRKDVNELARVLDEKLLKPLQPFLTDSRHLLISPDGQLSLIPFGALADEHGQYEVEHYLITYLSTGRDLLRMQVRRASKSEPVIVANPFYGEPDAMIAAAGPAREKASAIAARRSVTTGADVSSLYFAPLPGTAREAGMIRSLFPDAKLFTAERASKANLQALVAPSLLHIATHGFFLSDAPPPKTMQSRRTGRRGINASMKAENPLLRSGLALADANLTNNAGDNGILTALEASNLNLWGTKLVMLSACDTGVGEIKNGEGVYGLRRAFFLAGTESLVMTLWPVSDFVTRELVSEFYGNLKNGVGSGEALRRAQMNIRRRKDRQHPFYWASFIEAGTWDGRNGSR